MTQPQGALLVGSVNFDDAETTMRTASDLLGGHLRRIPDGEVGKRFHWIMFQPDVLGQADGIDRVGEDPIPFGAGLDARPLRIAAGASAAEIVLPPLGYAAAARESYAIFSRLRGEERFDSAEALVAQMDRDAERARTLLSRAEPLSDLDRALAF